MKRDFKAILEYLKKYIKIKKKVKTVVTHEILMGELKVKSQNLTNWKSRNTIPYRVVLDYCMREDINPLNVFYDRKVKP